MKKFLSTYKIETIIFLLGVLAVNAIFISKAFRQSTNVDPESAERLGAFVGGYIGSLFSLTGIVLLYATLKNQRLTSELQNFETKYFELIKMHRDNVAEMRLKDESGRRVFVLVLRELRGAIRLAYQVIRDTHDHMTQDQVVVAAYYCVFFGVGPNSSRMLKNYLLALGWDELLTDGFIHIMSDSSTRKQIGQQYFLTYLPFDGHQSRLGHYYRHLYQMVKYVDGQRLDIDKYEHVKTIRAQLSTPEQILLLVNSLTPMGYDWWGNELITKYRLVQNIPQDYFDSQTELDVTSLFDNPRYFEWQERRPAAMHRRRT
jgi:hypothetical protein